MKAVILAGGLGTRLREETDLRPKPMIEIGGRPMLWHMMKIYSAQGVNDFIICVGYRGYMIKGYFANCALHNSDVTFDFRCEGGPRMEVHRQRSEPWRVTIVDTGDVREFALPTQAIGWNTDGSFRWDASGCRSECSRFAQFRRDRPESVRVVGDLPGSDEIMNCTIFIGTYPDLTRPMLDYMTDTIRGFSQRRGVA